MASALFMFILGCDQQPVFQLPGLQYTVEYTKLRICTVYMYVCISILISGTPTDSLTKHHTWSMDHCMYVQRLEISK